MRLDDQASADLDRACTRRKGDGAHSATLVIADPAKADSDPAVGKALHRIGEGMLHRDVEAAGFKLVAGGNFWRNAGGPARFLNAMADGSRR